MNVFESPFQLTHISLKIFQFDNKGRNYLHVAVSNSDVDSVLFLISIEVNVNSHIQDGSHRTPLHLAIPTGSEIIVRHLVSTLFFPSLKIFKLLNTELFQTDVKATFFILFTN